MSMRISERAILFTLAAGLAGCSGPDEPESLTGGDESRVLCALGDEVEFTEQCDVERVQDGERRELQSALLELGQKQGRRWVGPDQALAVL